MCHTYGSMNLNNGHAVLVGFHFRFYFKFHCFINSFQLKSGALNLYNIITQLQIKYAEFWTTIRIMGLVYCFSVCLSVSMSVRVCVCAWVCVSINGVNKTFDPLNNWKWRNTKTYILLTCVYILFISVFFSAKFSHYHEKSVPTFILWPFH